MSSPGRPQGSRVTIRDVAERAGVATSTVSRALSDPERVHPSTRERIVAAAREVDYRGGSRAGVAGPSAAPVALLLPDVANPFYAEILRGTQLQLAAAERLQIVADTEESAAAEERAFQRVAPQVAGILLAATRLSDEQLRAAGTGVPMVIINRRLAGFSWVCLDTGAGYRQAVEHLVSLGHRHLAYLSGPAGSWSGRVRWRAARACAEEHEVELVKLGPFPPSFAGGDAAADALLNSRATAALAFNDVLAAGVVRRLGDRGIAVPEQMSVVGCDDIFAGALTQPALTTVSGDLQALGRTAVQFLLAAIDDPGRAPDTLTLATHLAVRGTTGSVAGG